MTSDHSPRDIVRAAYDQIGERYTALADGVLTPGRRHALSLIAELVPPGALILDIGCGAGIPMTAALAQRHQVHGVDVSSEQIARARINVPGATFEQADVVDFDTPPCSYDAVVAFYSLIHVPRESHAELVARIHDWLTPGGLFVASFGVADEPGTIEEDWLGAPMFFSHFDQRATMALIRGAGFDVVSAAVIDEPEHNGTSRFLWVAARAMET